MMLKTTVLAALAASTAARIGDEKVVSLINESDAMAAIQAEIAESLGGNREFRVARFGSCSDSESPRGYAYFTRSGSVGFRVKNLGDLDAISGVEGCADGGMLYHIHDAWDNIEGTYATGGATCGFINTQNHFDPAIACGPASNNAFCAKDGTGCVTGSSAGGGTTYDCSPANNEANQWVCEVGDLSGKFGKPLIDDGRLWGRNSELASPSQYFQFLEGKSVVFHCNSGARAFCALIQ